VEVRVEDLFQIAQRHYTSVGGIVVSDLSYQVAACHGVACGGAYVSNPGGSFRALGEMSVIVRVDSQDVSSLDSFIRIWKTIPNQKRVVVAYRELGNCFNDVRRATIINNLDWFGMTEGFENYETGVWEIKTHLPVADLPNNRLPVPVTFPGLENVRKAVQGLQCSFVRVSCFTPIVLNSWLPSVGIILDTQNSFIYVGRLAVLQDLCNVYVTFADSIIISAKVVCQMPQTGYIIIQYDTSLIHCEVRSIDISSKMPITNSLVHFVGMDCMGKIIYTSTKIIDINAADFSANFDRPKERAINIETCLIETELGKTCKGGILVDRKDGVRALWTEFLDDDNVGYFGGLPALYLRSVVHSLRIGKKPGSRSFGIELELITINTARDAKVPEA
jgi:hypothetical protein